MNFIKALQAKQEEAASLKVMLHRHLGGVVPARSPLIMHASEATKPEFCARRQAILVAANIKASDGYVPAALAYTFAQGRILQDWLVNQYADVGVAIGHWKCHACGHLYRFCKRPVECSNTWNAHVCKGKVFDPVEVRFRSPVSGIEGGFDMIASVGLPKLRLVEIKTIAADQFKTLKTPLPEHRLRTSLYLRIAAESVHPLSQHVDDQAGVVLYMSKGFGAADPSLKSAGVNEAFSFLKEFIVNRDDALTDDICQKAGNYTGWLYGKSGMPARECASELDPKAQKCPVRTYCFGKLFEPGSANAHPIPTPV